eukprot:352682-Chlamydomonas_euryale.AAC.5
MTCLQACGRLLLGVVPGAARHTHPSAERHMGGLACTCRESGAERTGHGCTGPPLERINAGCCSVAVDCGSCMGIVLPLLRSGRPVLWARAAGCHLGQGRGREWAPSRCLHVAMTCVSATYGDGDDGRSVRCAAKTGATSQGALAQVNSTNLDQSPDIRCPPLGTGCSTCRPHKSGSIPRYPLPTFRYGLLYLSPSQATRPVTVTQRILSI